MGLARLIGWFAHGEGDGVYIDGTFAVLSGDDDHSSPVPYTAGLDWSGRVRSSVEGKVETISPERRMEWCWDGGQYLSHEVRQGSGSRLADVWWAWALGLALFWAWVREAATRLAGLDRPSPRSSQRNRMNGRERRKNE